MLFKSLRQVYGSVFVFCKLRINSQRRETEKSRYSLDSVLSACVRTDKKVGRQESETERNARVPRLWRHLYINTGSREANVRVECRGGEIHNSEKVHREMRLLVQ